MPERTSTLNCGSQRPPTDLRFGDGNQRPWVMAFAAIIAVSTMAAAIAVLAARVVPVDPVQMTHSVARRIVLDLAVAGALAQISLLSFLFVWEKCQRWRASARHSE